MNNQTNNTLPVYDLIVVGGGINGAGIAADASGRGLSVALFEAKDFAGATSSASSKLIHGGLRYLEHYEFRLVSEALAEREVLLKKAPHIVKPMRFRLPHRRFLRPAWMIRIGMFLYDHLGKRTSLPASKKVRLNNATVMQDEMKIGFEYSDCWVDDARLTLLNILHAQEKGALVNNYSTVTHAEQNNGMWEVEVLDERTGVTSSYRAKALVNAAGPWVKEFLTESAHSKSPYGIRMIQGSHIIVPKIHDEQQAYILQNEDKRIVFVIPYLEHYSMIGTTDVEYHGDPREVKISDTEIDYLLKVVNAHFRKDVVKDDIVGAFSGVRPLCDDESDSPQAITRDYTLALSEGSLPVLSVFGGKLTTYRKLAESAMKQLSPFFPEMGGSWTASESLPGGENFNAESLVNELHQKYPFIDATILKRWAVTYGTHTRKLLDGVESISDLGEKFDAQLYQKEVDYLIEHEFARECDDILWRRTKLGLTQGPTLKMALSRYLNKQDIHITEENQMVQ